MFNYCKTEKNSKRKKYIRKIKKNSIETPTEVVKAPFGVKAERFNACSLIPRNKIHVLPTEYNVHCFNTKSFKTQNFIYPPFNSTSERFTFDTKGLIDGLSHRFYDYNETIGSRVKRHNKNPAFMSSKTRETKVPECYLYKQINRQFIFNENINLEIIVNKSILV
jgi:hypothetical protein